MGQPEQLRPAEKGHRLPVRGRSAGNLVLALRGVASRCVLHLLCVGSLLAACGSAAAQTVRSVGPFQVSFYNSGQSDEGGASASDWTWYEMDDVMASLAVWSTRITNTPARPIQLHLFWANLGSGILGDDQDTRGGNGATSWTYDEHAWRDGSSATGSTSYDTRIQFSTALLSGNGYLWNFTSAPPPDQGYIDFRSVVAHEMGHSLGFVSTYDPNTGLFSSQGTSLWDQNLTDGSGNRPAPGSAGTPGTFNVTANPVYFTGAHAVAAYGGNVPVYSPTTYEPGSSMSHLDDSLFPNTLPTPLMQPALAGGDTVRAPTPVEWAVMQDMQWSVAGVNTFTKAAGTLNWATAGNWSAGTLPSASWNVNLTNAGLNNGDTISLGGSQTINTLTLDSTTSFTLGGTAGTLTLNKGSITRTTASSGTQTIARPVVLGANAVWDIDGAGQLVFSGPVSGAVSVEKIDAGMVTFAAPVNLAGNMAIDNPAGGDVKLVAGGSLTANAVYGNGVLDFDGGSLTLTGTNSMHLYGVRVGKEGTGSFTLGAGKTLTTDTFLTVGRDNGGQGTFVNQSGTLQSDTYLWVGVYAGSSGTFIQQTDPTPGSPLPSTAVTGTTDLGDQGGTGVLQMRSGTFTTGDLVPGYGSTGTFTQSGGTVNVGGLLELAHSGQGTYNLNGGMLLTGNLTQGTGTAAFNFGGGTLHATAAFATSVPMTTNSGGATIDSNGFNLLLNTSVSGSGGLTKAGSGALTMVGSSSYTGGTTVSGGTLQLGDGTTNNGLVVGNILDNASLAFADPSAETYIGSISGSGSLTKSATGTLLLDGTGSCTGGTTVGAGMLKALALSGSGNTTVAGGATLQVNYLVQHMLTVDAGAVVILGGVSAAAAAPATGSGGYAAPTLDVAVGPTTVPEPSALVLLVAGAIALIGYAALVQPLRSSRLPL